MVRRSPRPVKGGRSSSVQAVTPQKQDPIEEEPAEYTQAQHMDMLTEEDAEEMVGEIMDHLLSQVMERCLEAHIKRQLVPFSASWAKTYLIQIIERQFITYDEKGPEEISKTEDSEPIPATPDAWAQGCVPVVNATPPPHPTHKQEITVDRLPGQRTSKPYNMMAQIKSSPQQHENKIVKPTVERNQIFSVLPPLKSDQKKSTRAHLAQKTVPSELASSLSSSAEKKSLKAGDEKSPRPDLVNLRKEAFQHKDYQPLRKLNLSSLPKHCIYPQYEILDAKDSKHFPKRSNGLSQSGQRWKRQQTQSTLKLLKPSSSFEDQPALIHRRTEADVFLNKSFPSTSRAEACITYSGPLRVETVDLIQGITLVDSQSVENTPLKLRPSTHLAKLKPIQSRVAAPLLSVDHITKCTSPRVTPLYQS
ncbi:uncharacterized protein C2orf81 homolog [Thalassophryne amazonica]|uniref:uncharacterized protein C2orf81 homolog n=1 Tax=Thalassophryne amazonica TaxID=390379 RepID=UPI00147212DB|nr:uncharacterized protein C2orf81 homolog [Thalassophryne amazonica]